MTDRAILRSFVPSQLLVWLSRRTLEPATQAISEEREFVVWAADLTDFSRLTNEVTELQRAGPEIVTDLLNTTFGTIIEAVNLYGGDVLGFGGDSVIATWEVGSGRDRAEAVALASQCGLAVHEIAPTFVHGDRSPILLRIGISVGTCSLMQVGGVDDRWHFVMGGRPFEEVGRASSLAAPGDVVLSAEAGAAVEGVARCERTGGGFLTLRELDQVPAPEPQESVELPEVIESAIRSFLSPQVLSRLDIGHGEWLAEFRRVTSVFINLPALDLSTARGREALQDVAVAAQRTLATYEGTLTRILSDEKGVTLISALGLPPMAHEEDPYRAVHVASAIEGALRQLRVDFGIGVATGRTHCGAYGAPSRRDYSIIGREVNLAARLMQAARFEILCDGPTARAAKRVEFHELAPIRLKGWDDPVDVFRPLWDRPVAPVSQHSSHEFPPLVGRDQERAFLAARLDELERHQTSALVVVEGEAGIGKTSLLGELVRASASSSVVSLAGSAQPAVQTPYHAWREVFEEILGVAGVASDARREEVVAQRVAMLRGFEGREALLNPVLGLQFSDTGSTIAVSGTNRRDATVALLVALLAEAASEHPLLLVLDDIHWFDSASWALTEAVVQKVSPIMLVLATRPVAEPVEELEGLDGEGEFAHVALSPVGSEDALALAVDRLGVESLTPELAELVVDGAEGIPFFVEELIHALEQSEALVIQSGRAGLRSSSDDIDVPHSLTSVVLSRIDRLSPQLQLTVKVASVLGRSFDIEALAAVHPAEPSLDEVSLALARLVELDLIGQSARGRYDFKHSLVRDAAYDLLLFDQRRRIHRNVGEFIESGLSRERETPSALLAHHWDRAEEPRKAVDYLERTGSEAVRRGAHREAIKAHRRSLELVRLHSGLFGDLTPLRRSQWLVEIGQAHEALGQLDDAVGVLFEALDLVGVHVPTRSFARTGRLIWEIGKQVAHIALPRAVRTPSEEQERIRLAQASRVAGLIGEIYYFTGNVGAFPVLNLISINLGEKAGEPVVAGLAYSGLGYVAGTLRLRRLAERYFRMSRLAERPSLVHGLTNVPDGLDLYEMTPGHLIAVSLSESVLALTFEEWDRARQVVDESLERCQNMGDQYSAGIALAVRGFGSYSTGKLDAALEDYQHLLTSALERSNREHEGWATSFVIPVLLAENRVDEAQQMAAAAERILGEVDPITVPIIHGTRSMALLRSGRGREALMAAEAAVEAIDATPVFIYLAAFVGTLETVLDLWGHPSQPEQRRGLERLAKEVLGKMRVFALALPFARPKYRLYRGRAQRLLGQNARAQRSLRTGLKLAVDNGLSWDEALLHLELAQTFPVGNGQRITHLDEARRLLERVGSLHDLEILESVAA